MRQYQGIFVLLTFLLALMPALGRPAQGGISFLDTAAKVTRDGDMVVNPAVASALQETTDSVVITGVPLVTGATSDFILRPAPVFTSDVQVVAIEAGGTTRPLTVTPKNGWIGVDPNHPNRTMFISAGADQKLHAMIAGDAETSVTVIKSTGDSAGTYEIVPNVLPKIPFCGESPLVQPWPGMPADNLATRAVRSTTMYDIELTLDISHDTYNEFSGNTEQIVNYLVDLVGAMNIIYHRDLQLNWMVNNVFIWNTPDNFSNPHPDDPSSSLTTNDQLYNYVDYVAANRTGVHFDLTQLIDSKPLGGLAYVNVLQFAENMRQYRSSVINVYATDDFPDDINEYYWDTMVICHELGHNVGSRHTQCYTPPIDCCAVDVGCSGCTVASPAAGTLMSYCHLQIGNGGSMGMYFHPRCISLMRPLIEASPLLTVHTAVSAMQVSGVSGIYIAPGSSADGGATLRTRVVSGPVVTQQFTILNSGDLPFNLTGSPVVSISGSPLLTITAQPGQTSLAPGTSTTFTLQFDPAVSGRVTATVSIPTNIPSLPNYSFQVAGQIMEPAPPVTTTFEGNVPIAEGTGTYTVIPISVTGVSGQITDVNVKFNGANCANPTETGLQHPHIGDVQLVLDAPDGTSVYLMEVPGQLGPSQGANLCNTLFDDAPGNPNIQSINTAGAPYTGTYNPFQPLSGFNGKNPNGTWLLLAYDFIAGTTGSIRSVSLIISGEQPVAQVSNWTLYK